MATHGKFPSPRRVRIVRGSGGGYFKPGQFAYAISWDERGGCHFVDQGGSSTQGERAYLVSKTKDMRGGALWFSGDGIRFTARRR